MANMYTAHNTHVHAHTHTKHSTYATQAYFGSADILKGDIFPLPFSVGGHPDGGLLLGRGAILDGILERLALGSIT